MRLTQRVKFSPDVQPSSDHSLRYGVELLHAELHEEGRGGDHQAVADQDGQVDHHLECDHAGEPHHLQRDEGQQGEGEAA